MIITSGDHGTHTWIAFSAETHAERYQLEALLSELQKNGVTAMRFDGVEVRGITVHVPKVPKPAGTCCNELCMALRIDGNLYCQTHRPHADTLR